MLGLGLSSVAGACAVLYTPVIIVVILAGSGLAGGTCCSWTSVGG